MNRLERIESLNELLLATLTNWQTGLWTALPGKITAYDASTQTCEVQPSIQLQRLFRTAPSNGTVKGFDSTTMSAPLDLPLLVDVPVIFPGAGGYTLTFPVAIGDEVLVVFSSRCIDGWFAQVNGVGAKTQPQVEMRMHDLSDGFAILGLRNQKRMLSPAPATNAMQLRSDDGQVKIEMAANHVVNISCADINVTASGNAVIKATSVKLQNAGSALKKLVNDTFLTLFDSHTHTSGGSGSPTSAPLIGSSPSNATSVTQAE